MDQLLQTTCEAIITEVAGAVAAELPGRVVDLRMPGGPVVGRQVMVDATEPKGLINRCRLSVLDPDLAPEGEAARIEYEHDKQSKFGLQKVYSIQSVRRKHGELVLLEDFLASGPATVREQDFRPILSETYAQTTVLGTLRDWVKYHAWQVQEAKKAPRS